ncbi:MAG TPA: TonB-dependent receptor [Sphingopyxis sp.]|uniref:TonB-dependent receptor n=1 Tax=Sphingopyxis sp. TaxID=1908224 RepID=UPI002E300EA6|nr:TonB-dependent receptor [Sphingopyxis sp.]HEX2813492.1 TonB-dependent receptor [Sphingopyxis sp.]
MARWQTSLLVLALVGLPAQVAAAEERAFNVPGGALSTALPQLSRQAGVSISVADARLWQADVRPVRGRMDVQDALKQMLAGTDARAVRVNATSWRIERRAPPPKVAHRLLPRAAPQPRAREPAPVVASADETIIVTATKTDLPYSHFAGVATRLDGDDLAFGGERGTDSILSRVATISSTYLGAGRNKLFIRGIADSSFTGPTQATVGQYLGDVRLSYNAPDPDLRLYDIDSVEVLEGPQGTLYGAGSLGGIIRSVPKAPDPRETRLQAIAGVSATQHGDPGGDIAGIVNVPVGDGGSAVRLLGYMLTDGGYIDNPLLGKNDVNRTHIWGGRAAARIEAGDNWTIDLSGVYQAITSDDAQYADKDAPPLTRSSLVEQNARTRYGLGTIVIQKDWDGLHFQSSNAVVSHRLFERFDAGKPGEDPRILDQYNRTRMFVSETRLSRPFVDGFGWVIGASVIDNRTRQRRQYGTTLLRAAVPGVTNEITEFTGYAEATLELLPHVIASAGGRISHARLGGEADSVPLAIAMAGRATTAHRTETDLLPSFSLLATPFENLRLYARYQEGFRPGGLAIDGDFVRRFRNDQVRTWEGGIRFGEKGRTPFDASVSVSHTRWRDIQADFIDGNGFPTTANIGNGRITSISGAVAFRPVAALSFDLGAVYNHSRVDELSPLAMAAFADAPAKLGRIPNVASHAVRGAVTYVAPVGADAELRVNGWANYIGPSRLGIGPVLGEGQGDYVDTGLALRLGTEHRGLSLTLTNLFDARGNRFALGTPFVEGGAGYITPLRPRTIRIAVDVAY